MDEKCCRAVSIRKSIFLDSALGFIKFHSAATLCSFLSLTWISRKRTTIRSISAPSDFENFYINCALYDHRKGNKQGAFSFNSSTIMWNYPVSIVANELVLVFLVKWKPHRLSHYRVSGVVNKKYHESFAMGEGRRAAHSDMPRISIRYCAAIIPCSSGRATSRSPFN